MPVCSSAFERDKRSTSVNYTHFIDLRCYVFLETWTECGASNTLLLKQWNMHEVFSSDTSASSGCTSNARIVKRTAFLTSWALPMGQVWQIHHHFRRPRSLASCAIKLSVWSSIDCQEQWPQAIRSAVDIFAALFQPDLCKIAKMAMGNHENRPCRCRPHHLRKRRLQHRLGATFDVPSWLRELCIVPGTKVRRSNTRRDILGHFITLLTSWLQMTRQCKKSESR